MWRLGGVEKEVHPFSAAHPLRAASVSSFIGSISDGLKKAIVRGIVHAFPVR
jgi:hypothetical protein